MRRRRLPPATHGTGALPQPHAQGRAAPACPAPRFSRCRDRGSGGNCASRRTGQVHAGPVPSAVSKRFTRDLCLPWCRDRAVRGCLLPSGGQSGSRRDAAHRPCHRAAEQARRYRAEPGHRSAAAAASPLGPECDCGHGLPEENVLCSNIRRSRTARRDAACRRAGGRKGVSAAFSPECGIGSSLVPRTFFNACCRS